MFFPGINNTTYNPQLGFCENNKIPLTLLAIGGALTALGIALLSASANPGVTALAGVVTTIGVPMLSYGTFMLIYNRCTHGGDECGKKNEKKNEETPIEVKERTGPETEEQRVQREKLAEAAEKRREAEKARQEAEKNNKS